MSAGISSTLSFSAALLFPATRGRISRSCWVDFELAESLACRNMYIETISISHAIDRPTGKRSHGVLGARQQDSGIRNGMEPNRVLGHCRYLA